jgi:hypothetical protein
MLVSLQVCREFLVVLTRQPVSGRVFALAESLAALEVWLTGCQVLEETVDAVRSEEAVSVTLEARARGVCCTLRSTTCGRAPRLVGPLMCDEVFRSTPRSALQLAARLCAQSLMALSFLGRVGRR